MRRWFANWELKLMALALAVLLWLTLRLGRAPAVPPVPRGAASLEGR